MAINFIDLYQAHMPRVMRRCMWLFRYYRDADNKAREATMDILINFHKRLEKAEQGKRSPVFFQVAYVLQMTENHCNNIIKEDDEGNNIDEFNELVHAPVTVKYTSSAGESLETELMIKTTELLKKTVVVFQKLFTKEDTELRSICRSYYIDYMPYKKSAIKTGIKFDDFHNSAIEHIARSLGKDPNNDNDIQYIKNKFETRSIFFMRYFDEMTLQEIADKKGCTHQNIDNKLKRIVDKMNNYMENDND